MQIGRAVEFDRYGALGELHFVPQERPVPAAGEVVVEVIAAGLNHMENFIREGRFADRLPLTFPARQGSCFAGVVRAVGDGVRDLHVGSDVMGHAVGGGAHATWVTVPRGAVVPKPETIPFEVAGGLYLAGCTAFAIVRELALGAGDVVVISAAAGAVGHIECQLALADGATVIGTCSPRNHDYLRSIGVVPVTYGEGIEDRIRAAAIDAGASADAPVTAFIDNHGVDEPQLAEALGVERTRFSSSEHRRDTELRFIEDDGTGPEAAEIMQALSALIEHHKVRVLISGFYPFEYIVDAFDDLAERHSRGKVVIGMQPVETGRRLSWYRSEKARTVHER